MSEQLYGVDSVEAKQGFVPLSEANPVLEEEEKTYDSEQGGLTEAANEYAQRSERNAPPIERTYIRLDGSGEPSPETGSVKMERAARDLAQVRADDDAAIRAEANEALAQEVDRDRAEALMGELPAEQPPQPQPETPAADAQPGVDPEIQRALENPKIRQALEQHVAAVSAAGNQYTQAAIEAAQVAAASLFANFPELNGLNAQQVPVAMRVLESQNPQRAAAVRAHLMQTKAVYDAAVQAQAREQQTAHRRFEHYAKQQDDQFEDSIKSEPPEIVKQCKAEVIDIAEKQYGITREELAEAYRTQPIMRTAAFQRMMFDATRYHIAQRTAKNSTRPVPPVQRPGVAVPYSRGDDSELEAATTEFRKNPTIRTAQAALLARRARANG